MMAIPSSLDIGLEKDFKPLAEVRGHLMSAEVKNPKLLNIGEG